MVENQPEKQEAGKMDPTDALTGCPNEDRRTVEVFAVLDALAVNAKT
jgi:hypothetical protein